MESIRVSNTEKSDAGTFGGDDIGGDDVPYSILRADTVRPYNCYVNATSVREAASPMGGGAEIKSARGGGCS